MKRSVRWIAVVAVLLLLAGGTLMAHQIFDLFGVRARACEQVLTDTAAPVTGVLSAEADCSMQFGGGWQRQELRLSAATLDEAYPIVEQVLKALASEREVENVWSTPQVYELTNGTTLRSLDRLGFNGPPNVADVRSHYGIQPVR